MKTDRGAVLSLAKAVVKTEKEALDALEARLGDAFMDAVDQLLACRGRIIVTGIGKSGHIGNKIAATFASTGSPASFVHAAEASHGDMGMMQPGDVVIAISYSGTSDEILKLIPGIKRMGLPLIALTGKLESPMAQAATVIVDTSVAKEACPLGLAPTASTTCTLVAGDALAVALLQARGFDANDFARSHPGGRLGRQLLLHVSDVMSEGSAVPRVNQGVALSEALLEITRKGLGMVTVVDDQQRLIGIFTDGDLRRSINDNVDIHTVPIDDVMTSQGRTITADELAVSAVSKMQKHKISSLPVLDGEKVVGVITMLGLLAADVV